MTMNVYARRRAAVLSHMRAHGGGVAIVPTAAEVMRNADADYPYRHDSYFYYLTGFTEPEAFLILVAGDQDQSILFCREKNEEREIWDGYRFGPEAAKIHFGFDASFPISSVDSELPRLMANAPALFYALGSSAILDSRIQTWLNAVRSQARAGVSAPTSAIDIRTILNEMRLIKDDDEIAIMQRAADISAAAHARAMRVSRPGLREYHLEAELLHEFRSNGSQSPAYGSIVATGANACVLHYRAGDAELRDGDLVLIDAGCELDSYASDITRTFPVNGKFSPAQKTLYEIVLESQYAAIAATRAGARFTDGHDAALRVLTQGMLDTGLLDKNKVGSVDDVIAGGQYRQFYMHRTGHWLGMDVHDVGDYRDPAPAGEDKPWRTLAPGMVLTIEPGIYVRPAPGIPEQYWNIGIRIEDDALVTAEGCEILTHKTPKTITEIETVMRG
jgi:Xaa-Pro aminopeptidase